MATLTSSNPTSHFQTLNGTCSRSNPSSGSQQRQCLDLPGALKMPDKFASPTVPNSHGGAQQFLQHYHHAPPQKEAEENREQRLVTKSTETSCQLAGLRRTTTPADYAASLAGLLSSPQHHHQSSQQGHSHNHHSPFSAESILGITKEALRISKGSLSATNTDDASSASSSSSCSLTSPSNRSPQQTPPPAAASSFVPHQVQSPAATAAYTALTSKMSPCQPITEGTAASLLPSPEEAMRYIPATLQSPQQQHGLRLNKFVRRLHDMLQAEKDSGVVEWRRGLLVLHSTDIFAKNILPKYFNTRNFKTFRRQLNYYGFVHVRSFSSTTMGSSTTALWVNQLLAQSKVQYTAEGRPVDTADVAAVLLLKRVEPCDAAKTAEGRRARKELAIHTVEDDLGVNAKTLQLEQIRSLAFLHQPHREQDDAVQLQAQTNHLVNGKSSKQEHEAMDIDETDRPCTAVTAATTLPAMLPQHPTSSHCRRSNSLAEGSVGAVSLSSDSSLEMNNSTATTTMCAETFVQPRISRTQYYHHLYSRAAAAASACAASTAQEPENDDDDDESSRDNMTNDCSVVLPPKQENASAANLLLLLSKSG